MSPIKPSIKINLLQGNDSTINSDYLRVIVNDISSRQSAMDINIGEVLPLRDLPKRDIYTFPLLAGHISRLVNSNDFSICICELPLEYYFCQLMGNCGMITLYDLKEIKFHIQAYISFHIAKLVALHFYPILSNIAHETDCPIIEYARYRGEWQLNVGFGHLCRSCLENLNPLFNSGEYPLDIKDFLDLVFMHISQHEAKTAGIESSLKSFSHTFSMPIEFEGAKGISNTVKLTKKPQAKNVAKEINTQIEKTILRNKKYSLLADNSDEPDALRFDIYADLLCELIKDKKLGVPLTIGIGAKWGKGKSFLLNLLKKRLKTPPKTKCIEFNAWEYAKTGNIWLHLYFSILDSLRINQSFAQRMSFTLHFYKSKYIKNRDLLSYLYILFSIVLFTIYIWHNLNVFEFLGDFWTNNTNSILTVFGAISVPTLIWTILRSVTKIILPKFKTNSWKNKFVSQEQIIKNIQIMREWHQKECSNERVVILIDDLDRCIDEDIIRVLESLYLFQKNNNIVVIIAMDTDIIQKAIGSQYKYLRQTNNLSDSIIKRFGSEYLEKIIQVPFRIPSPSKDDILSFASNLFDFDVVNVGDSQEADADQIKGEFVDSDQNEVNTQISKGSMINKDRSKIEKSTDKSRSIIEIDANEKQIIEKILRHDGIRLSPRLLKRFRNIYTIERRLIEHYDLSLENELLESFIAWSILSVQFPFEAMLVDRWLCANHWEYLEKSNERIKWIVKNETDDVEIDKPLLKEESLFNCDNDDDHERLAQFIKLFIELGISSTNLKISRPIYSCFNMLIN